MDLNGLNKEQREAVTHINGPMLVLAGAGSGKTRVLTNRIAYLIENGVDAENILAITFTNKAAKEMKEREIKLIGKQASSIQISTFHSLGLRLLKENYSRLGYKSNFVILDSDDTLTVVKKIMKEMNLNPKFYNAREIRNKISSAKNELMSPSQYAKLEFDQNIIKIYEKYKMPMYIGGHSKGGNLAVYASVKCGAALQNRILEVYNHDGPGFNEQFIGIEADIVEHNLLFEEYRDAYERFTGRKMIYHIGIVIFAELNPTG